ncbi:MAG: RNA-binding S4 domain-containing protein [Dysosmobacter sp.]
MTLGKRHILFEIGDTQLICRRLEGEFLDYKNAIPRKNPIQIVAETKALIESIDRVSVVISDKLKSPVRCLFDHDKVMLSAKTGNGEAKDVCRVSGDGDRLEIGFNNRYLMEALRYRPGGQGEDRAEHRGLPCHYRPCGGRGELPLYGIACTAEERGVNKYENNDHYNGIHQASGPSEAGERAWRPAARPRSASRAAVQVNGEVCTMRGKKIRPGDVVTFRGQEYAAAYAD